MNSPEVPRGRKIALVACMFLITGTFGFIQAFVPLFLQVSGLSRERLGWVLGIATATALLVQPVLGKLSDRLDARRPLMVGAALLAWGAYTTLGKVSGFWPFLGLIVLGSNGFTYLNQVGGVLVGRIVSAESGGAGYARYRVWGSVGYVVVTLITGFLLSPKPGMARADLAPIFVYGPLLYLAVAALAFFVPDPKRAAPIPNPSPKPLRDSLGEGQSEGMHSPLPQRRASGLGEGPGERAGLGVRAEANLRRFFLAFALYTFALYGMSGFLPVYMRQLGATGRQITWMFAAGVVCEVLVMMQVGRWTDQNGRKPALLAAFFLMPVRLLLYIPALGPLWVIGVQSLHGLNFGIVGTVSVAFVNDYAKDGNRGALQARLAATTGIATALGQVACGWLAQRVGISGMFAVMSGVGMVAAGLLTRVQESRPK